MEILVIAESHKGKHLESLKNIKTHKVELLSLQGHRGINLFKGTYFVSKPIREYAKKFDLVILGTDLDFIGTKIASILYHNLFHSKVVRMAFTNRGYVKIGEVFEKSRIGKLLTLEKRNMITAKKIEKATGIKGITLSKALILREVYKLYKEDLEIKVLNKKTSTITALVQGFQIGFSPKETFNFLVGLYSQGIIEYPRTDAEYIEKNPYNLYPHSPLPKLKSPIFEPIAQNTLGRNAINALLHLSNERLITPSTALNAFDTISQFFYFDLTPKEEFISLLEYIYNTFGEEDKGDFKNLLGNIYNPQLYLSPAKELSDKLLSEIYDAITFTKATPQISSLRKLLV